MKSQALHFFYVMSPQWISYESSLKHKLDAESYSSAIWSGESIGIEKGLKMDLKKGLEQGKHEERMKEPRLRKSISFGVQKFTS